MMGDPFGVLAATAWLAAVFAALMQAGTARTPALWACSGALFPALQPQEEPLRQNVSINTDTGKALGSSGHSGLLALCLL